MKYRKRSLAAMLALVMLFTCASCGKGEQPSASKDPTQSEGDADTYEKLKIKISYSTGDTGLDGLVANYMKEQLAQRSGGAITLECYGNATLASGNMARQVEMLIAGSGFEMAILGEQLFGAQDPQLNVTNIPFAFESYEEVYQYADSTGGEFSAKALGALGVKYLGTFPNGMSQLGNSKKEIRTPEDLKGMKMRAVGELMMAYTQSWGCDVVSINFSELYSALQMGTVDGQTNSYITMDNGSLQEVQPYITEVNCSYIPFDIVYNMAAWDKLPEKTKELITEVAAEAALYGRQYSADTEGKLKQKFMDEDGVTIVTLTEEEHQAWVDTTQGVIDQYIDSCGEEACRAWGIID